MIEWLESLPPIPVTTLLQYIFAIVLSLLLLAYLVYLAWRSWRRLDELELKDRFAARNDFIKTTAQILGGAFFLLTIVLTYLNLKATQEKNVTDLYTKAIEQLGSNILEVRVGGIYALERIARESPKDHWTIMEVLTAFVREKAPLREVSLVGGAKKKEKEKLKIAKPEKPPTDIQAVLTVLGRTAIDYAQKGETRSLDLQATHLAGADLTQAKLQGTLLTEANLQGAHLWKANLQGAVLLEANLQRAFLRSGNLQRAYLQGANLREAVLRRADLREAKGLTAEQVARAIWDRTTRWPEGFSPPPRQQKEEKKE